MRRLLGVLAFTLLFIAPAQAQLGETSALFLEIHPQPRIHALGEATVALRGYPGAVDINPATIGEAGTLRGGTNISGEHLLASDWLGQTPFSQWIATPSVSAKRGRWAGAAQLKYFDLGTVQRRDPDGTVLDERSSQEWSFMLAGAYDVTPNLSVGAATQLIRSKLSTPLTEQPDTPTVLALDLGVQYRRSIAFQSGVLRPSLGASLNNFGPNIDYQDDEPGDQALPVKMRVGGALEVETQQTWAGRPLLSGTLTGQLSKVFANTVQKRTADGEVYTDADGPFTVLFASGWGTAPGLQRPSGEAQLSVWEQTIRHAGAEVQVADLVSLRWGRFHEDEQNGNRQFTTYGFGVDLYYVDVDHSWTAGEGRLDNSFWRITARIPLTGEAPTNFWPLLLR